jgi:hypothetical protein
LHAGIAREAMLLLLRLRVLLRLLLLLLLLLLPLGECIRRIRTTHARAAADATWSSSACTYASGILSKAGRRTHCA